MGNDKKLAFPLSPRLRKKDAGFDSLSQAYLISKNCVL